MSLLNPQDTTRRLGEIRAAAASGDFEKAHSLQDDLLIGTLEVIAAGYVYPKRLADEVLEVVNIDFQRVTA